MGRARPGSPHKENRHTVKRSHLPLSTFACPSPHGVRVAWHAAFTAQPAQQGDGQPLDASLQPAALPPVLPFNAVIASWIFSPAKQSHGIKLTSPQVKQSPVFAIPSPQGKQFPSAKFFATKPRSHKGYASIPSYTSNPLRLCDFALKNSRSKPLRLGAFALNLLQSQKTNPHPLSGKIGTCEA
jgi:hypothetical protein